jgi:hypothetical protein
MTEIALTKNEITEAIKQLKIWSANEKVSTPLMHGKGVLLFSNF